MEPFNGLCETPEQKVARGVITVSAKRSGCDPSRKPVQWDNEQILCFTSSLGSESSRLLFLSVSINLEIFFCCKKIQSVVLFSNDQYNKYVKKHIKESLSWHNEEEGGPWSPDSLGKDSIDVGQP